MEPHTWGDEVQKLYYKSQQNNFSHGSIECRLADIEDQVRSHLYGAILPLQYVQYCHWAVLSAVNRCGCTAGNFCVTYGNITCYRRQLTFQREIRHEAAKASQELRMERKVLIGRYQ